SPRRSLPRSIVRSWSRSRAPTTSSSATWRPPSASSVPLSRTRARGSSTPRSGSAARLARPPRLRGERADGDEAEGRRSRPPAGTGTEAGPWYGGAAAAVRLPQRQTHVRPGRRRYLGADAAHRLDALTRAAGRAGEDARRGRGQASRPAHRPPLPGEGHQAGDLRPERLPLPRSRPRRGRGGARGWPRVLGKG